VFSPLGFILQLSGKKMFYLLIANKCELNHKKTWFKQKKNNVFFLFFKKTPKNWFKPEKPGLSKKKHWFFTTLPLRRN
jgi:hypothetical protein